MPLALSFHGAEPVVQLFISQNENNNVHRSQLIELMTALMLPFLALLFAFGVLWHDQPAREP